MSSKKSKVRNWLAVHAHLKSNAGQMGDKRKENSKRKCREQDNNEHDEYIDNLKQYKIVAFESKRFEIIISAKSEYDALDEAKLIKPDEWIEDYDYYNFSIASVEKEQ